MTATFLLPFAIGVCTNIGGNVVTDAFGVVAMVAMTPLITIQTLGLVYELRSGYLERRDAKRAKAVFEQLRMMRSSNFDREEYCHERDISFDDNYKTLRRPQAFVLL